MFQLLIVFSFLFRLSTVSYAQILPDNSLWLEDDINRNANMTKEEFSKLSEQVVEFYLPLAAIHGGNLTLDLNWDSPTVNAYATQFMQDWQVAMFGQSC